MVCVDVSTLAKAKLGTSLTFDIETGPQRMTDLEVGFFRGTVQAIRVQGGILIRGTLESQLQLECVRCLEPFVLPIPLELEEMVRLPGTSTDPEAETSYTVSESGTLDLTPLLREQAWLAIPMKPLCRPDCQGLCPMCGANLNLETCSCEDTHIDPRLAALKDLL
jgi:uncharacterized protein